MKQEKQRQPKDYALELEQTEEQVVQSFEEWIGQGYNDLNAFEKFTWQLQDNLWKVIFIVSGSGYLAGTYFGVFW